MVVPGRLAALLRSEEGSKAIRSSDASFSLAEPDESSSDVSNRGRARFSRLIACRSAFYASAPSRMPVRLLYIR